MSDEPPQRRLFRLTTDKEQRFVRFETRNTDVQIELAAVLLMVSALMTIIGWIVQYIVR